MTFGLSRRRSRMVERGRIISSWKAWTCRLGSSSNIALRKGERAIAQGIRQGPADAPAWAGGVIWINAATAEGKSPLCSRYNSLPPHPAIAPTRTRRSCVEIYRLGQIHLRNSRFPCFGSNVRKGSRLCENVPHDKNETRFSGEVAMKRFVEGVDRGQSTLFPNVWTIGSTRTTRFV